MLGRRYDSLALTSKNVLVLGETSGKGHRPAIQRQRQGTRDLLEKAQVERLRQGQVATSRARQPRELPRPRCPGSQLGDRAGDARHDLLVKEPLLLVQSTASRCDELLAVVPPLLADAADLPGDVGAGIFVHDSHAPEVDGVASLRVAGVDAAAPGPPGVSHEQR